MKWDEKKIMMIIFGIYFHILVPKKKKKSNTAWEVKRLLLELLNYGNYFLNECCTLCP